MSGLTLPIMSQCRSHWTDSNGQKWELGVGVKCRGWGQRRASATMNLTMTLTPGSYFRPLFAIKVTRHRLTHCLRSFCLFSHNLNVPTLKPDYFD